MGISFWAPTRVVNEVRTTQKDNVEIDINTCGTAFGSFFAPFQLSGRKRKVVTYRQQPLLEDNSLLPSQTIGLNP